MYVSVIRPRRGCRSPTSIVGLRAQVGSSKQRFGWMGSASGDGGAGDAGGCPGGVGGWHTGVTSVHATGHDDMSKAISPGVSIAPSPLAQAYPTQERQSCARQGAAFGVICAGKVISGRGVSRGVGYPSIVAVGGVVRAARLRTRDDGQRTFVFASAHRCVACAGCDSGVALPEEVELELQSAAAARAPLRDATRVEGSARRTCAATQRLTSLQKMTK